ncbi:unnamed protein product [Didymodactylos carnosus]|uniref:Uncharacterized protein n=2 Tax=Didymodactylos carnosus TaxID=1234261 RepID=A0A813NTI5_9BILA|nr:unnamed protein product [Didymodactylos carnosus]CAF3520985.1 unnamed protein product [Didymodactylos carnosus]
MMKSSSSDKSSIRRTNNIELGQTDDSVTDIVVKKRDGIPPICKAAFLIFFIGFIVVGAIILTLALSNSRKATPVISRFTGPPIVAPLGNTHLYKTETISIQKVPKDLVPSASRISGSSEMLKDKEKKDILVLVKANSSLQFEGHIIKTPDGHLNTLLNVLGKENHSQYYGSNTLNNLFSVHNIFETSTQSQDFGGGDQFHQISTHIDQTHGGQVDGHHQETSTHGSIVHSEEATASSGHLHSSVTHEGVEQSQSVTISSDVLLNLNHYEDNSGGGQHTDSTLHTAIITSYYDNEQHTDSTTSSVHINENTILDVNRETTISGDNHGMGNNTEYLFYGAQLYFPKLFNRTIFHLTLGEHELSTVASDHHSTYSDPDKNQPSMTESHLQLHGGGENHHSTDEHYQTTSRSYHDNQNPTTPGKQYETTIHLSDDQHHETTTYNRDEHYESTDHSLNGNNDHNPTMHTSNTHYADASHITYTPEGTHQEHTPPSIHFASLDDKKPISDHVWNTTNQNNNQNLQTLEAILNNTTMTGEHLDKIAAINLQATVHLIHFDNHTHSGYEIEEHVVSTAGSIPESHVEVRSPVTSDMITNNQTTLSILPQLSFIRKNGTDQLEQLSKDQKITNVHHVKEAKSITISSLKADGYLRSRQNMIGDDSFDERYDLMDGGEGEEE